MSILQNRAPALFRIDNEPPVVDTAAETTVRSSTTHRRVVLIGCSKTKRPVAPNPKTGGAITPLEMYCGPLFLKRVQYAERSGAPWRVLSARYGAWRPFDRRKPYDETLSGMSPADYAMWHASVAYHVLHELWEPYENNELNGPLKPSCLTVEIHAGRRYARPLADILRSLGVTVELPCEGMGIGQQLALYTSGKLQRGRGSEAFRAGDGDSSENS